MWKANGETTTLKLFLDSLSPKTVELSLEEAMDLSRDRLILELDLTGNTLRLCYKAQPANAEYGNSHCLL
jgi:hypothetical protein